VSAYETQLSIIEQYNPELLSLVREIVADIAQHLGESPEAWRGAEIVADHIVQVIGAVQQGGDKLSDRALPSMMLVMSSLTVLSVHPMTPWAQEEAEHEHS
jgi:hypothetical protein